MLHRLAKLAVLIPQLVPFICNILVVNVNKILILFLTILVLLSSCKVYKQDIMFKLDDNFTEEDLSRALTQVEKNYKLQINDRLILNVFTNKGERIVDPNFELSQGAAINVQNRVGSDFTYLVQTDGTVKFPIIGQVMIDSLTINEAEALLQSLYDQYYKESFVKLQFANKRVVVLGAVGGKIVPLENENMSLMEVLALAGGLEMGDKAHNIKLIRGEPQNPQVYQINLATVHGMQQTMLDVEPGDIIYVEPWRRPVLESIRDIAPVLSMITSTIALIVVFQNL